MKTFLVHLDNGRSIPVKADSYMELEHRWHFYRKGEAVAFSFFEAAAVDSRGLPKTLIFSADFRIAQVLQGF